MNMNNLFKLNHGREDNDLLAAQIEVPLTFRVHQAGQKHNARTIKSEYILRTGSHHGFGLSARFAYRLYQDLSASGNSIDRMKGLHTCNLEALASNPHNISAILQYIPKGDIAKMIELAYPGAQYGDFNKSDFSFFVKNSNKQLEGKPGSGLLLIAEIYTILQLHHRIEPDNKLQKKLDAVITASQN